MNKKLAVLLSVLVVILIVMCVVCVNRPAMPLPTGEVTTISDDDIERWEAEPEEYDIPASEEDRDVKIDFTDIHKMLFEFDVNELTGEQLTRSINMTFESESIPATVDEDTVYSILLDVKQHVDGGMVYLVIHCFNEDGVISSRVDVCSYADRINPVLAITLTKSGDAWTVSKE